METDEKEEVAEIIFMIEKKRAPFITREIVKDNMHRLDDIVEENCKKIQNLEMPIESEYNSIGLQGYHDWNTHSLNMSMYVKGVGNLLGLPRHQILLIEYATEKHDMGKMLWPSYFLNLTGEKFANSYELKIKEAHSELGEEIIQPLNCIAKLVRHHHERFDGRGYPDGKKGEDIPLGSRIIFVLDSYDAMVNKRKYRHKVFTPKEAIDEIKSKKGHEYDPLVVDCFVEYQDIKDKEIIHIVNY